MDKGHPPGYRREEIQKLVHAIEARENRLVLGLPGIGKSNLLRFLVARSGLFNTRRVMFVYLEANTLSKPLDHDRDAFFEALVIEAQRRGLPVASRTTERGYERFKRLVVDAGADSWRLVFVVDQADEILAAADDAFYRNLKALTNLNKNVCYIFGASPMTPVALSNPLFAGRRLAVGRLNKQNCRYAITEEAKRQTKALTQNQNKLVARLTDGYPSLIREVVFALKDQILASSASEGGLIEAFAEHEGVQARCQRIWAELDDDKHTALHEIASGLWNDLDKDKLKWFQDFGLLDNNPNGPALFSPLFQKFVAAQEKPDKLTTPVPTGEVCVVGGKVFKGNQEITLTLLAQKLLQYLMTKPGWDFTNDDISLHVWGPDAATNDQIYGLVAEIRRKIGKEHIHNHTKRGYSFVP